MPFDFIREVGQIIDLVEQMWHETGAIYTLPNQANQTLNTAQWAYNEVEQAKCYLKASK